MAVAFTQPGQWGGDPSGFGGHFALGRQGGSVSARWRLAAARGGKSQARGEDEALTFSSPRAVVSWTCATAAILVPAWGRQRRRARLRRTAAARRDPPAATPTEVKESDPKLDWVERRRQQTDEELELLSATGALKLQEKEEAYLARKEWREKNPSPMDQWEMDMEEARMDTWRRKLWGDMRSKSGDVLRRYSGKRVLEKEIEIKYNRGFPVEDTIEQEQEDQAKDKEWMNMWRAQWPQMEAVNPYDPESFGFGFVGTVTGAHGLHGDVRVHADDLLMEGGYDPKVHLARRNYSNWTEEPKRVHLKAPHRRFPRPFRIITGKRVRRRDYALNLHGIDTIEDAEKMVGYKVYVLEPPPSQKAESNFSGEDLYDASTTHFHTHDAMQMIGADCTMLVGDASDEVLAEFADAETPEEAAEVLERNGLKTERFGTVSAVVPDYKVSRRHKARMVAANLLDITLLDEFKTEAEINETIYENDLPDAMKTRGMQSYTPAQLKQMGRADLIQPGVYERVCYVPFVPDMIARVDATRQSLRVTFCLPKGHIERTAFHTRKRVIDERGLLTMPRSPTIKALLPSSGKSIALRRRDGKPRPLHGTAPAAPLDMPVPAGQYGPDRKPGVPKQPKYRKRTKQRIAE